jgi:Fe-S cluster assembly iron-binding protein IscA
MEDRAPRGAIHAGGTVSTTNQPEVLMTVTPVAGAEVMKFMQQEGVDPAVGGLRVSVQPGGCSGFKYGLLIEDQAADDDLIVEQGEF